MKLKKKLRVVQNIISVEFKDDGQTYLFGSLSAIYSAFSADDVGITYESLKNTVGKSEHKNMDIDKAMSGLRVVYNNRRSRVIVRKAPLLLGDKADKTNDND